MNRCETFIAIIAGGRKYNLTDDDYAYLDSLHAKYNFSEVVSGCATGADSCGESWANRNNISVKRFPANWDSHPTRAGNIRNGAMARYANVLVLFPGGSGTKNMYEQAINNRLIVFDRRYQGNIKDA